MKKVSFICVSGFFSSGSSAVVDLLKEFSNTFECGAEIRLIKDPHGISQLENALVDNWELINSSAAIDEYYDLCKKCARAGGKNPFSPAGLGYTRKINRDFLPLSREYIDKLTSFKYKADFYYYKFRKNYFKYIVDRWRWAIEYLTKGKLKTANRNVKTARFSYPSQTDFCRITQEYFQSLFENKIGSGEEGYIILDQAVSPNTPTVIHRYFRDAKMIVVSRDPRDMYIDNILWGVGLDHDLETREAGRRYAMQQKALRSVRIDDPDILYLRFEDLVSDYDTYVPIITSFLHFSENEHKEPRKYLIPEKSKKNIGIWKQYYSRYKDAIDEIEKELKEYCYYD